MAAVYTIQSDSFSTLTAPDRYLGGSSQVKYHPYVKGYFYVFFQFPKIVTDAKSENRVDNFSPNYLTLLSLCEGFTPPGDRQLKTEDVTGIGGVDATFVVGQTIDRTFSLMYRDVWGSPIFIYHRIWTSIIDPFLGGVIAANNTVDFVPALYKGRVLVVQTKPIALKTSAGSIDNNTDPEWNNYIIKVHLFDGVFPVTDLNSVYDSNINDNTIVRPTVQYRFDGKEYDETVPGVRELAANAMKNLAITNRLSTTSFSPTITSQTK